MNKLKIILIVILLINLKVKACGNSMISKICLIMKTCPYALVFFFILFASCTTKPGKVEFPFEETEYTKPNVVKTTPTLHAIPDSLPIARYITEQGQLVVRDQSIPLKKPSIKKAGQPKVTVSRIKKIPIPTNQKKQQAGVPKKVEAKGKTVPARGKVVKVREPISKPYIPPAMRDQDTYGFRHISQDQNLPGTVGNALLEDSQGRIWIGTDNGLAMLEGGQIKVFTTREGLSSNYVVSLLESSTGAIWIGTDGGGVNVFESGSFILYGEKEGLSDDRVYNLLESSSGAIWIGTYGGGVNVFESGSFVHYGVEEGLSSNRVFSLLESSTGSIWLGTDKGVDVFESGSFVHYGNQEGLSSSVVYSLLESASGAIWIGTREGVFVLESGIFVHYGVEEGLSSNLVYNLLEDSAGAIWIGTYGGGVDVFESGSFVHYGVEEGLSSNLVYSLLEDSTGAIWIGTLGGGVDIFQKVRFLHYGLNEGINSNVVYSLLEDSTGAFWTGTLGGGVDVFKSGSFLHYGVEEGLSGNRVYSLLESASGAIWIGNGGGVDVFKSGSFLHYGVEEGLSNNSVYSLLESSTGAIWIGTLGGGVNVFESGRFVHYDVDEGLSNNRVYSLLESSTGAIWIGTNGGVDVFESGSFFHYGLEEGLSSNSVRCLLESSTGAIWIGTSGGGVDVFESGSFVHYGVDEGLADNAVLQLAMDSLGNVWAGTGNGLTRFVAKEKGYELTSWNKTHGLKFSDFNGPGNPMFFAKTVTNSKKGTMWSGVGQVLTAFEPPLADTLKPTLFLTGVDIGQKQINWNKISNIIEKMQSTKGINPDTLFFPDPDSVLPLSNFTSDAVSHARDGISWGGTEGLFPYNLPQNLELPYDQNHLTFHYSGLKLSEQFDVVYRYILEGMDKEWSPFTQEGKVDYRNIPYGSYIFKVRARGRNFLWSDEASISFVVNPPWWHTWWAYCGYGLLTGFALLILDKVRRNKILADNKRLVKTVGERTKEIQDQKKEIETQADKLLEMDKLKSKFFANISHEFRTPLTLIQGPLEKLLDQNTTNMEVSRENVSRMFRSSKRLQVLVNQLLDLVSFDAGKVGLHLVHKNVFDFIRYFANSFTSLAEVEDIEYIIDIPDINLVVPFDSDALEKIYYNLLANAFKFTPKYGQVTFSIEVLNDNKRKIADIDSSNIFYIKTTVKDTGEGISASMINSVFERFTKNEQSQKAGVGIGLSLVKELVNLYKGELSVESTLGIGTTFTVILPVDIKFMNESVIKSISEVDDESTKEVTALSLNIKDVTSTEDADFDIVDDSKAQILIIEDNKDVRDYIVDCLKQDYNIETANNGIEGLEIIKKKVPDLVISDVIMPKLDGMSFLKRIKNDEITSHIPVILLTAKVDEESRLEAYKLGADAYLIKPFGEKELLLRIQKIIEQREKLIDKYTKEIILKPSNIKVNNKDEAFIKKTIDLIEENIDDSEFGINSLQSSLGVSRMQLHRKLIALTKMSTSEFIKYIRLLRAEQLLKESSLRVSEVGYAVGFSDPSYFSKCFKEQFGVAPSDFSKE